MKLSDAVYRQARALIASRLGLDFAESRQADLERGLMQAYRTSAVSAPETYVAWLATLPAESPEWKRLAGYLTVSETYFFRDRAAFEALERQILPTLIAARRAEGVLRVRLWSAGCSTGEEPYSLAIVLDRLLPDRERWTLTILATDINADALERARQGRYRAWSLRETPAWIRDACFRSRSAGTYELDARIRGMVTFAPLNLAADSYLSATANTDTMDLIFCRNVLMYFTPETQRATVARLQRALVGGGWLMVSPAEASADLFSPLSPVNFPGVVLYHKASPPSVSSPAPFRLMGIGASLKPPLPLGERGAEGSRSAELVWSRPHPDPLPKGEGTEFPPGTPTDLQRARALADQGHLEQARHLCEGALVQDRLALEAYLLLGMICQEQGESQASGVALRRAIYLAPDSAPAHFLLGNVLLRLGERKRARHCMEIVVNLLQDVPRDEEVWGGDGLTAGRFLEMAQVCLEPRS